MANEKEQNLKNHNKVVPAFHMFVLPLFLVNLITRLVQLRNGVNFGSILAVLMALGFILLALYARMFAITVQDRVIRLEMQLRLARLLPPDLHLQIDEFTVGQLIALRFASDQELPLLARQVLEEKLTNRKEIKRRVKNWRADYLRA
jgi:uncharacterized membrane protein YciS (DUF1049 family)